MSNPWVAGLGAGLSSLGADINKRKARKEEEEFRAKEAKASSDRAMAQLLAKREDDVQIVTGEDEDGPGIFAVNKQQGTKKRITNEEAASKAMSSLTGAPSTPLLRKPGMAMPTPEPVIQPKFEPETHGVEPAPVTPQDTAPPKRALGLRPPAPKPPPPVRPQLVLNDKNQWVPADPFTGTGPGGKPVSGYHAPDKPNLITVADPKDPAKLVRAEDKPGQEVPGPGSISGLGSAAIKKAIATNRTQLTVIDDAIRELDKHPEAVGAKRAVGDVVPFAGGVSDFINQRADPKGVMARAQISNVASLIIHDRSGAAVTVSEFPRLAPFIPRQGDTPQVVRDKMAKLKQNIEQETGFLEQGLSRNPVPPGGRGAAPSATPPVDPLLVKYGIKPKGGD